MAIAGVGLLLAGVFIFIVAPAETAGLRAAGLQGFDAGIARTVALPVWLRIVAVVTAGVVEDTLLIG